MCIGRDCMIDCFFVLNSESFTKRWCFSCCRRSSSSLDFMLSQSPMVGPVVVVVLSRTLRSVSDTLNLQIPRTRLSTVGVRAFSVFGPFTLNDLHLPLRQEPSLDSLKCNLKKKSSQNCRPAMFCSVLLSSSISVAAYFKLCKLSFA